MVRSFSIGSHQPGNDILYVLTGKIIQAPAEKPDRFIFLDDIQAPGLFKSFAGAVTMQ
jgi:hypothetical protein